jgi:acetyl-CoA/propionyl-CoA carboxylase biotin carboxyl carrier protein
MRESAARTPRPRISYYPTVICVGNDGSSMIGRVLVANRGEIARRIFRACRELEIATVAIYGDGESRTLHVREADDAYHIGGHSKTLPYLDVDAIVATARRAGADAIHPGYGFLAENPSLARATEEAGLIFVGPCAESIRAMGDKVEARSIAADAGVPIVPGSERPIRNAEEAADWAERHGYPVALKAAGGGGGRGFRVAENATTVATAFAGAASEAERSFANRAIYIERYIPAPRHIEIQIFADGKGNIVSLGERECSIQRRHQKLIEETPSPAVDPGLRHRLGESAVALAQAVNYRGAGTVEFLLDASGNFYFLEMNTRIQVEHTVTEMVTGLDLVKEQLLVASGHALSFGATDIEPRGHAIECRINAEDVAHDFAPAPGTIADFREPSGFGIRVDAALESGDEVLPTYDSLIAKLVAWGRDRSEAIARMQRGLGDFTVTGVPTTVPFHQAVMRHPAFQAGNTTTAFLANHPEVLVSSSGNATSANSRSDETTREMLVEVGGRRLTVRIPDGIGGQQAGRRRSHPPAAINAARKAGGGSSDPNSPELISPVQGTVVRIDTEVGQTVKQGQVLMSVEAMKMENAITAHRDGTVTALHAAPGESITVGAALATIG